LRLDHAAAVDAVQAELSLTQAFGSHGIDQWNSFEVQSRARSKAEYLLRPDLGRELSSAARAEIAHHCVQRPDFQVAVGDGLSAAAVAAQVPALLPLLAGGARARNWAFGRPFLIHHCRVGILNDIGELIDPTVVVLLVGERPGLATAESLSAYLAYRPRAGHTDAQRNLISNIHRRGVAPEAAAQRILRLAEKMRQLRTSGVAVKEDMSALTPDLHQLTVDGLGELAVPLEPV
jgi:ethanolamine ammonia-lyase small subunit